MSLPGLVRPTSFCRPAGTPSPPSPHAFMSGYHLLCLFRNLGGVPDNQCTSPVKRSSELLGPVDPFPVRGGQARFLIVVFLHHIAAHIDDAFTPFLRRLVHQRLC